MQSNESSDQQDQQEIERKLDAVRRRHQQCVPVVELDRQRNRNRRNRKKQEPEQDAHRRGWLNATACRARVAARAPLRGYARGPVNRWLFRSPAIVARLPAILARAWNARRSTFPAT